MSKRRRVGDERNGENDKEEDQHIEKKLKENEEEKQNGRLHDPRNANRIIPNHQTVNAYRDEINRQPETSDVNTKTLTSSPVNNEGRQRLIKIREDVGKTRTPRKRLDITFDDAARRNRDPYIREIVPRKGKLQKM